MVKIVNGQLSQDVPHIYLDSNVLIDLIHGTKPKVHEIINKARKEGWKYSVSAFTIMESLEIEQEHMYFHKKVGKHVPLKEIINKRRERDLPYEDLISIHDTMKMKAQAYDITDFKYFAGEEGWMVVLDIVRDSNITSFDAIHLVMALASQCHILVTSDRFFEEEGNKYIKQHRKDLKIVISSPEKVERNLKEMGFSV